MYRSLLLSFALAVNAGDDAACTQSSTLPPGLSTFPFASGTRQANVYVPRSLNISAAAPLVVFVHGWTASCRTLGAGCDDDLCLFRQYAESRGFIFAALCSPSGSFNAGACCPPANSETEPTDDVAASRALVRALSKRACVDPRRVYATGFSNGGMLAQRLACEAPDVFRAVASVAGTIALRGAGAGGSGLDACRAAQRAAKRKGAKAGGVVLTPSVLDIHGADDGLVPSSGSPFLGFPAIPAVFKLWADLAGGCRPPVSAQATPGVSQTTWSNCTGGAQLSSVTLAGTAHEWVYTPSYDATAAVLDFFDAAAARTYGLDAPPAGGYPAPRLPAPKAKASKTPRPARRERVARAAPTPRARERGSARASRDHAPQPVGEELLQSGPLEAELGASDARPPRAARTGAVEERPPHPPSAEAAVDASAGPSAPPPAIPVEQRLDSLIADMADLMEALQY